MVALRVVLNTWGAHDLQHPVRAEEALMQAFIPGTGPFRFRFEDHEAGRSVRLERRAGRPQPPPKATAHRLCRESTAGSD